MSVKDNIVKLRALTGVTQEELGRIAGVSRSAVSLWEIGESEPRMGAVQLIADYFHIRKANIIEDGGMDNVAISTSGRLYELDASAAMTMDEQELMSLYRECTDVGREYILQIARITSRMHGTSSPMREGE